jgi:hypothetical protein
MSMMKSVIIFRQWQKNAKFILISENGVSTLVVVVVVGYGKRNDEGRSLLELAHVHTFNHKVDYIAVG